MGCRSCGVLFALVVLSSAQASQNNQPIAWDDPRISIWGRHLASPSAALFGWPGFRINVRFSGTSLTMRLSSNKTARFAAAVDGTFGATNLELSPQDKKLQVCSGLSAGVHTCTLMLVSESIGSAVAFLGVDLHGGVIHQATNPSRRFEIYGDSDTVGFSIDGPYPESSLRSKWDCLAERNSFTDTRMAWGTRLSERFRAEPHFMAISGVGVTMPAVHRLNPMTCGRLPDCMNQSVSGDWSAVWDASQWVPDAIFLLIGANDFVNDPAPSDSDFTRAYTDFLRQINTYHSGKPIPMISICAGSGLPSGQKQGVGQVVCPLIQNATSAFNTEGRAAKAHTVALPSGLWEELYRGRSNYTTCLDHWTVSGQRKFLDDYVTGQVAQILQAEDKLK